MKESTMKKQTHKMGKHTGYEKEGDKIFPASMYTDQFMELANQETGIKKMLNAVTEHAQQSLTNISKQQRSLWDRIIDDLKLDNERFDYEYNYYDRYIIRKLRPPDNK